MVNRVKNSKVEFQPRLFATSLNTQPAALSRPERTHVNATTDRSHTMIHAAGDETEFNGVSPVFPVADVPAAVAFYRERLGFDLGWIWGDPPTHASVCRGVVGISLALEPSDAGSGEAYVELRGVDGYYAVLRARNVELGELHDRPYGMRDFALVDLDGNRLVFGEPTVA
jgi:catechol 2,3-dioxygenase-like lactoylglutathione lyase family enzyme